MAGKGCAMMIQRDLTPLNCPHDNGQLVSFMVSKLKSIFLKIKFKKKKKQSRHGVERGREVEGRIARSWGEEREPMAGYNCMKFSN